MSIAQTASRLLVLNGEPIVFSYVSEQGAYDPITGETTEDTTATIDGSGYPSQYKQGDRANATIEDGDIRLICEVLSTRPAQGWNCTIDGEVYRVVSVQAIRKSASDIIYICQLRR